MSARCAFRFALLVCLATVHPQPQLPHLLVDDSVTMHPAHSLDGLYDVAAPELHQQRLRLADAEGLPAESGSAYGRGGCWDGLNRKAWRADGGWYGGVLRVRLLDY